jgi:transposase
MLVEMGPEAVLAGGTGVAREEGAKARARGGPGRGPRPGARLGPMEVDRLLMRADHLVQEERALIRALYMDGRSSREVAELIGADPRSVRRRARRIAMRVLSPEFTFVLRQREQWGPTRRRIATVVVLQGKSMRQAAAMLELSLHTVRHHFHAVAALFEAAQAKEAA